MTDFLLSPDLDSSASGDNEDSPDGDNLRTGGEPTCLDMMVSLRAACWSSTAPAGNGLAGLGQPGLRLRKPPSPGIKFVHGVPEPLRQVGCMWLENGDEHCRCGRQAAWIMGNDLSMARLYCEEHGQVLNLRRCLESQERRRRKMRLRGQV